jgi:L-cystine transport system permease protein
MLNAFVKQMGLGINVFDINPIIYAFVVFSLNTIAALAEIFRSALLTVERGQLEAALAVGLSPAQAYVRIIIPQALVSALPNICNTAINLIKGTSLAFIMTVKDITAVAKIAASYGYNYIEAYLDIFIIYVIICGVCQWLFTLVENHLGTYKGLNRFPQSAGGKR